MLLAAFALSGWARLDRRVAVARAVDGGAVIAVVIGGAYTAAHFRVGGLVEQLRERTAIRAEMTTLLHAPAVAAARECGAITVPNHKLLPEIRWALGLPENGVRARSDRTLDASAPGLALVVRPPYDKRPALYVYEVPADGTAIAAAPAGHTLLASSRRFEAWGRC